MARPMVKPQIALQPTDKSSTLLSVAENLFPAVKRLSTDVPWTLTSRSTGMSLSSFPVPTRLYSANRPKDVSSTSHLKVKQPLNATGFSSKKQTRVVLPTSKSSDLTRQTFLYQTRPTGEPTALLPAMARPSDTTKAMNVPLTSQPAVKQPPGTTATQPRKINQVNLHMLVSFQAAAAALPQGNKFYKK